MKLITDHIVGKMIEAEIIAEQDRELYAFGLEQGMWLVLNLLTMVVIGLLMDMLLACLYFLLAYVPLRIYAGGYHARTPLHCYFGGIVLMLTALLMIKWFPWTMWRCAGVMAIASLIIWRLAPVEDSNKPLDEIEKTVYARRARKVAAVEIGVVAIAGISGWLTITRSIAISFGLSAMVLMLGKLNVNKQIMF